MSQKQNQEGNHTLASVTIPDDYNAKAKELITLWHAIAVSAGLRFLAVDQWTQATANAIAKYEGDLQAARLLFEHAVTRERAAPTRWRKSLCRVLNAALSAQQWFEDFAYNGESVTQRE